MLQTVSRSADVPLKDLMGLPMAVAIADDRGGQRIVAGFVCRPEALVSDGANTLLQAEIRDVFGVLSLRKNRRIYRDQSVVEVVSQILDEHIRANSVLASNTKPGGDSGRRGQLWVCTHVHCAQKRERLE
ncbi:MAG: phage late control D family protein [Aquabacterium sp.]